MKFHYKTHVYTYFYTYVNVNKKKNDILLIFNQRQRVLLWALALVLTVDGFVPDITRVEI